MFERVGCGSGFMEASSAFVFSSLRVMTRMRRGSDGRMASAVSYGYTKTRSLRAVGLRCAACQGCKGYSGLEDKVGVTLSHGMSR